MYQLNQELDTTQFISPKWLIKYAKKGDMIEIKHINFCHWALYIGDGVAIHLTNTRIPINDSIKIRHFIEPNKSRNHFKKLHLKLNKCAQGLVVMEKLTEIAKNYSCRVNNKDLQASIWALTKREEFKWFTSDEVAVRAKQMLTNDDDYYAYEFTESNCEHFVTYWKYNVCVSDQVNKWLEIIYQSASFPRNVAETASELVMKVFCLSLLFILTVIDIESLICKRYTKIESPYSVKKRIAKAFKAKLDLFYWFVDQFSHTHFDYYGHNESDRDENDDADDDCDFDKHLQKLFKKLNELENGDVIHDSNYISSSKIIGPDKNILQLLGFKETNDLENLRLSLNDLLKPDFKIIKEYSENQKIENGAITGGNVNQNGSKDLWFNLRALTGKLIPFYYNTTTIERVKENLFNHYGVKPNLERLTWEYYYQTQPKFTNLQKPLQKLLLQLKPVSTYEPRNFSLWGTNNWIDRPLPRPTLHLPVAKPTLPQSLYSMPLPMPSLPLPFTHRTLPMPTIELPLPTRPLPLSNEPLYS